MKVCRCVWSKPSTETFINKGKRSDPGEEEADVNIGKGCSRGRSYSYSYGGREMNIQSCYLFQKKIVRSEPDRGQSA